MMSLKQMEMSLGTFGATLMFIFLHGAVADVGPIAVTEGDDLDIKWEFDSTMEPIRQITYWKFSNGTSPFTNIMLKSEQAPALAVQGWEGKVEELPDYNAGIRVKNVNISNSGNYSVQVDLLNEVSYRNQTVVMVVKAGSTDGDTDTDGTDGGSNAGLIVGVVVAVIVVIVVVVVVVLVVRKKYRSRGL